jgi:hypothetical protein
VRAIRVTFRTPPEDPAPSSVYAFIIAETEPIGAFASMNAHINYHLPQALLRVTDESEFDDEDLLRRRLADHRHLDTVPQSRIGAEDAELTGRYCYGWPGAASAYCCPARDPT